MAANSPGKAERLAAALRENLKRRKARARALDTADSTDAEQRLPAHPETDRGEGPVEAER